MLLPRRARRDFAAQRCLGDRHAQQLLLQRWQRGARSRAPPERAVRYCAQVDARLGAFALALIAPTPPPRPVVPPQKRLHRLHPTECPRASGRGPRSGPAALTCVQWLQTACAGVVFSGLSLAHAPPPPGVAAPPGGASHMLGSASGLHLFLGSVCTAPAPPRAGAITVNKVRLARSLARPGFVGRHPPPPPSLVLIGHAASFTPY